MKIKTLLYIFTFASMLSLTNSACSSKSKNESFVPRIEDVSVKSANSIKKEAEVNPKAADTQAQGPS